MDFVWGGTKRTTNVKGMIELSTLHQEIWKRGKTQGKGKEKDDDLLTSSAAKKHRRR